MKILCVILRYDQGDPRRGDSFEFSNFYSALEDMSSGVHQVLLFPFDILMKQLGRREMNAALLKTVSREKPNLCFFSLIEDEIDPMTVKNITKSGITTLAWFGDDEWRFETHSVKYAPYFSFVATTSRDALGKYERKGYRNALPTAAGVSPRTILAGPCPEKNLDVSFVGSWSAAREQAIRALQWEGISVEAYGTKWPNGRLSHERMLKFISRSKISLALNTPSFAYNWRSLARLFLKRSSFDRSIRDIRVDFPNFLKNIRSWRQKKIVQLKARTFEVPARRTLLMTQDAPGLSDYYKVGEEIVVYQDTSDLIEKARYFLDHSEEREAIARAGYERTVRNHTYEKRFADLFAAMKLQSR